MTPRFLIFWFTSVALLALFSRAGLAGRPESRCAMDGQGARGVHRVELVAKDGTSLPFCSLDCAGRWPDVAAGSWWRVHDEVTGQPLDSDEAIFVMWVQHEGSSSQARVAAFEHSADASRHAADLRGRIVPSPLTSAP